jgi:hypothetical protein
VDRQNCILAIDKRQIPARNNWWVREFMSKSEEKHQKITRNEVFLKLQKKEEQTPLKYE